MRALIVLIVALLSAPAFGDGHMARNDNPGFGDAKRSEGPPKPRAKPTEEFEPLPQAERDKIFKRSLDKYKSDPEFRDRVLKKYEQLKRLHSERPEERGA